ncbi:MAG: hypothetical protein LUC99_07940 [Clostridiales bacterium]|nr:hypothetical protein [Clostridiales bacterium]
MSDNTKITKLKKAIADAQAEVMQIRQQQEAAKHKSSREALDDLLTLEKRERVLNTQIKNLKEALAAATYTPPEPTDREELLRGYQRYFDAKTEKIEKVNASVKDAERERREIMDGLRKAAKDCDAEKTIELSAKKEENEKRLNYIYQMAKDVAALPVFPDGAIASEWEAVCDRIRPDWEKAALRVETLAAQYSAACSDLKAMERTIKSARDEVERMAQTANYSLRLPANLTKGMNADRLMVKKTAYIGFANMIHPVTGRAI